jgi:hypothetical protein
MDTECDRGESTKLWLRITQMLIEAQRDNIIFGREWEEETYWTAVRNASLMTDLELLPDGDLTEIGEKGISK